MVAKPRIAVYPGTFDPITTGHLDIIRKALKVTDHLIVAVAVDSQKTPIFSVKERVEQVQDAVLSLRHADNVIEVVSFEGLLVDFAKIKQADFTIRGLRAVSDFEYEFQMSCMNTQLAPDLETIFIPASDHTQFIASRFVKEIARLGGDISQMVTPMVKQKLTDYYGR